MSDNPAVDAVREAFERAMVRTQVRSEARALGAVDEDVVAALADLSRARYDEVSDAVIGAREAVEDLRARKPYLFGQAQAIREHKIPPPRWSGVTGKR